MFFILCIFLCDKSTKLTNLFKYEYSVKLSYIKIKLLINAISNINRNMFFIKQNCKIYHNFLLFYFSVQFHNTT